MYRSAHVLEIQGKLEEAEQAYQRLLDLQQERLGASHSDTMMTLERLTELFKKQKRADQSEYTCRKLFRLQKKMLGPQNHKTLATLSTLGMLLDNSKSPQAQYVYLELTKSLKDFDYTCLSFSQSFFLWKLGFELYKRKDYKQAEQVFRGYLLVGRRPEGFGFPTTCDKKFWLAMSLFSQEKYPEAELMFRDCLNLRERTRGIQDPEAMNSVYWLARSLFRQQKFSKAEEMYKDLLELLKQGFLVDGLDKTSIARGLSHSLHKQQKLVQAYMVFLREAVSNPFLKILLSLLLPFLVLMDNITPLGQFVSKVSSTSDLYLDRLVVYYTLTFHKRPRLKFALAVFVYVSCFGVYLSVVIDAYFGSFSHLNIPQDWKGVVMSGALEDFRYLSVFLSFVFAREKLLEAN